MTAFVAAASALVGLAVGCPFAPRCPRALELCSQEAPGETTVSEGHTVWCHNPA